MGPSVDSRHNGDDVVCVAHGIGEEAPKEEAKLKKDPRPLKGLVVARLMMRSNRQGGRLANLNLIVSGLEESRDSYKCFLPPKLHIYAIVELGAQVQCHLGQ